MYAHENAATTISVHHKTEMSNKKSRRIMSNATTMTRQARLSRRHCLLVACFFLFKGIAARGINHGILRNVYGTTLLPCSSTGMARASETGECLESDHSICLNLDMRDKTGENKSSYCSDRHAWCASHLPCHDDEASNCAIEQWCVSQVSFAQLVAETRKCNMVADKIMCDSTSMATITLLFQEFHKGGQNASFYEAAINCLVDQCQLDWGLSVATGFQSDSPSWQLWIMIVPLGALFAICAGVSLIAFARQMKSRRRVHSSSVSQHRAAYDLEGE